MKKKYWLSRVIVIILIAGIAMSSLMPTVMAAEMQEEETAVEQMELLEIEETAEETKGIQEIETENRTVAGSDEWKGDAWDDPELDQIEEKSARANADVATMSKSAKDRDIKAYGIDVYSGDGDIDWEKVKTQDIDFVIIRIGFRGYGSGEIVEDSKALDNISRALNAGLKVGVYFFSTAITSEEALEEAKFTIDMIKDYNISYPVVYDCEGYDIEDYRNYGLDKETRTDNAITFLDYVESQGYKGMMYSSAGHLEDDSAWLTSILEEKYEIWVAQYWYYAQDEDGNWMEYPSHELASERTTSYAGKYSIWQCSSQGIVEGIDNHYVDLDIEYYPVTEEPSLTKPVLTDVSNVETGVRLTWAEISGATGYYIYRRDSDGDYINIATVRDGSATVYTDTDVSSGETYFYTAAAFDDSDQLAEMVTEKADEMSILCLSAPILIGAENVVGGVNIRWEEVTGATGYYIYRKEEGGKYSLTGKVAGSKTVSYTDKEVESGKNYVYTVRAGNGKTLSYFDSTSSVFCLTTPVITDAVNVDGGISVSWEKVTGATGYYVYRKEEGGKYSLTGKAGNALSYTDKTAQSGKNYIYTVRAGNGKTLSYFDLTKTVLCLDTPVLSAAESVQNGIKITWEKVSSASGYYIYRKIGDGKWSRIGSVTGGSTVSYIDSNAAEGTTYTYTVRAYKGNTLSWFKAEGVSGQYSQTLVKYKTTEAVNYRTGPGTSYSVVGTLSKGAVVQVVSGYSTKVDGYTWYKIYLDDRYYYVCASYLKKL